jgi:hypothetical protein
MRQATVVRVVLALILSWGCLAPILVGQEESQNQQDQNQEQQRAKKKSAEAQAEGTETKNEPRSRSLTAYRLEFTLSELDDLGKKINSRTYSLVTMTTRSSKIRVGGRVPVATNPESNLPQMQFQYLDIGMNIDCFVEEQDGFVILNSQVEASSAAPQRDEKTHQPVIRQLRSDIRTVLAPGKPTVVASMDDPTSKERFQLDVTATKVK